MNEPPEPELPEPFVWVRIFENDPARNDVKLCLGKRGEAVASVTQMSNRWHVAVDLHLASNRIAGAGCASRAQGMRWAARWLAPRAGRILIEIGETRLKAAGIARERGWIPMGPGG